MVIAGITVREDDVESDRAIRAIARLFRGMSGLLLTLMVFQIIAAATSTVPLSAGVIVANALRPIIFAGLLWGTGDFAVFVVKSRYDVRATRILTARIEHVTAASRSSNTGDASTFLRRSAGPAGDADLPAPLIGQPVRG